MFFTHLIEDIAFVWLVNLFAGNFLVLSFSVIDAYLLLYCPSLTKRFKGLTH